MTGYLNERLVAALLVGLALVPLVGRGQQDNSQPQQPAAAAVEHRPGIYFPQAPLPGQWRQSVGITLTPAPPELTEELRISIPALDIQVQRGLSQRLYATGRLQTQFVQTSGTLGLRYALPLSKRLFLAVGDELNGWHGFLKISDVFNSQAAGLLMMPNLSVGFRPASDLQYTLKVEAILGFYYGSSVGGLRVSQRSRERDGFAVTFMLEQPYYHKRHISMGFRGAYTRYNWQFWALYSTFDKPLFYPELIFNFIHY
ncbi:hypothetical protein FAES_2813 [Fibrella aestuarina BUZ 2]|uniref:Uncharacterized protein n=1 Tax=Fibrella aestuarina BUZ 2 TaxID=1166018 RepID=I0K9L9_9BACT|nr:hypothetical protein [Fibrella aestuarina]CCH00822.1 hypothetical protein FAES_2813 [Fibrella aestuarina BUZ 2]